MYHSLALIASSFICKRRPRLVAGLFGTGILLFSGSLYTMTLTENRKLGAITPIGGLCLIAGWCALAFL